jgi:hypothetical protein
MAIENAKTSNRNPMNGNENRKFRTFFISDYLFGIVLNSNGKNAYFYA